MQSRGSEASSTSTKRSTSSAVRGDPAQMVEAVERLARNPRRARRGLIRGVLGLGLLLLVTPRTFAQGAIYGCVVDELGDPSPHIGVHVAGNGPTVGVSTGKDGCYEVSPLAPGKYTVYISWVEERVDPRSVVLRHAERARVDFTFIVRDFTPRERVRGEFVALGLALLGSFYVGVVLALVALVGWHLGARSGRALSRHWPVWTFAPLLLPVFCIVVGGYFGNQPAAWGVRCVELAGLLQLPVMAYAFRTAAGWRLFACGIVGLQCWLLSFAWWFGVMIMIG
jgi:hypothetical protein